MYALAGLPCTAVFVSAAKPLDDENTNGFENFCAAAAFLETRTVHGVFAAYANSGENAKSCLLHVLPCLQKTAIPFAV